MAKKTSKSVKNSNETRLVCPTCGTEFAIPEHTTIGVGIIAGKDSNLGTVELQEAGKPAKKTKAQERIDALKKAGVNTEGLISIKLGTLGETVGRIVDGVISVISDDDPIYQAIISHGTIPNRRLFRRWVMSQMFHMLSGPYTITEHLKNMDYNYTWRMLRDELRAQVKLAVNDPENFSIRNDWFNKILVTEMANDYLQCLKEYIDGLHVRHCRRREYKRIHGNDFFVSDIPSRVFLPLYKARKKICDASTPAQLADAVDNFCKRMIVLGWSTSNSKSWMESYKGAGAYYTMENLIRFHNCRIINDNGVCLDEDKSMEYIKAKSHEYAPCNGWRMIGLMKKLLADNGVDIKAKIKEWHQAKLNK